MTNTEFLTELHTQVLDCLRKCEDALDLLDGHDGRVPAKVRRALKELFEAAYDASHVVYYASEKKVQRFQRHGASVAARAMSMSDINSMMNIIDE
jgi:hypothetical protein